MWLITTLVVVHESRATTYSSFPVRCKRRSRLRIGINFLYVDYDVKVSLQELNISLYFKSLNVLIIKRSTTFDCSQTSLFLPFSI